MNHILDKMKCYDMFMIYEGDEIHVGIWQETSEKRACLLAGLNLYNTRSKHSYKLNKAEFKARKII